MRDAAGSGATRACDLYALGALALELLTGKPPYDYPSVNMTLAAVLHEKPSLPSARGDSLAALDPVFERALAREPECRFTRARELVDALSFVLTNAAPPAARAVRSTWRCAGHQFAQAAFALACLVLARSS